MKKEKKAAIKTAANNGMDAGNEICTADTLTIDNDNAPENDAINDAGDDQSAIGNELAEGTASDADECDLNVNAELETGMAADESDTGIMTGNAFDDDAASGDDEHNFSVEAEFENDTANEAGAYGTIVEPARDDSTVTEVDGIAIDDDYGTGKTTNDGTDAGADTAVVLCTDTLTITDFNCFTNAGIHIGMLSEKHLQGFPLDVFPEWARNQMIDISLRIQVPVVIAANLFISLVAACISLVVYISVGRHREQTNIWTLSLAAPGTGKSPVFRELLTPLMNSDLWGNVIGDITIPFFYELLEEKQKLFMFEDELGFFKKLVKEADSDYSSLTHSYDGTYLSRGCCRTGAKAIGNPALTMGLAGQQKVFKKLWNSEIGQGLLDSGILDRLITVLADSTGPRDYMTVQQYNDILINATYQEKMDQLISFVQNVIQNGDGPIDLKLPSEVDISRRKELQSWEDKTVVDNDFEMIHDWIRKADGLSLRLTAIMYMVFLMASDTPIDFANLPPISMEVMDCVIRLLRFYRDQTVNVRHWVASDVCSSFALRVYHAICHAIQKNRGIDCSMRDVKQGVRDEHGQLNEDAFNVAIEELVDNEWITVEEPPRQNRRGRPASARIRIIRGQSQNSAA